MSISFNIMIFICLLKFIRKIGHGILRWVTDYATSEILDRQIFDTYTIMSAVMLVFAIMEQIIAMVALLAFVYSVSNLLIL